MKKLHELARITSNAKLAMYSGELKDFLSKNKNKKVSITFEVIDSDLSAGLRGYYFSYVVPRIQQALLELGELKTKEETDEYLRELSPVMATEIYSEKECCYVRATKRISEIGSSEMMEHIEFIKRLAAQEMSVFINDPN